MRYFVPKHFDLRSFGLIALGVLLVLAAQAQTDGMAASIQQVHLQGTSLSFDVYVQAQGKNKEYLGFCDFVWAFEKGRLAPDAQLVYLDGSMQLQTAEQQLATRYPLTYVMRVYQKENADLVYLGIDPPRFREASEFVAWVAEVDGNAQLHRVGRFEIQGVLQAPDSLHFHSADKGLRTQCYNFRPSEQYAARATRLQTQSVALEAQWLEFFEANKQGEEVGLKWQPGELFAWKSLSVERSYDGTNWEELAFTPPSARNLSDRPNPPALLEGRPLVYYRLVVGTQGDKRYVSAIRLLQF